VNFYYNLIGIKATIDLINFIKRL